MLTDVDQCVQARLLAEGAGDAEVTAALRYRRDDPLAARMTFPPAVSLDGTEVTWTFARSLLAAGLREPSGEGDVHIWPCGPDRTMVELWAPEGCALVALATTGVRRFLSRAYAAVPAGAEERHIDMDALVAALLADGRGQVL